jgi:serine protease inhibitor ecotin
MSTLVACPRCDKTKEFIDFSLDDLYQMRQISEKNPYLIEEVKYIDGRISAFEQIKFVMIQSI